MICIYFLTTTEREHSTGSSVYRNIQSLTFLRAGRSVECPLSIIMTKYITNIDIFMTLIF